MGGQLIVSKQYHAQDIVQPYLRINVGSHVVVDLFYFCDLGTTCHCQPFPLVDGWCGGFLRQWRKKCNYTNIGRTESIKPFKEPKSCYVLRITQPKPIAHDQTKKMRSKLTHKGNIYKSVTCYIHADHLSLVATKLSVIIFSV